MKWPAIIPMKLAALCLPLAVLLEYGALLFPSRCSFLVVTAAIRSLQAIGFTILILNIPGASASAGFTTNHLYRGIRTGLTVSAVFGLSAAVLGGIWWLTGRNPFNIIGFPIPYSGIDLVLFFVTGGIISPIAEEIMFRGIVFPCLKPLGLTSAVILSAAIFAAFHGQGTGLPIIQFVGGVVFAISFERSDHIISPVIVHCTGNLALFSIALLSS